METMTDVGSSLQPVPVAHARTVLILGMHRSGTSALSRVLNLMGVELGQDLMPPAADNNETGFWEHRLLQWINQRIFESVGREWNTVLAMPQRWWEQPQLESLRAELRLVIGGEFGKSSLWGLKDPRVSFMLPLWRPLLREMNCDPCGVLIFRNPAEVARSLEKRDHMPRSQSYLMWLRSLIEGERGSRDLPRTLTSYEGLLSDWKAEIQKIGRDLKVDWPARLEEMAPAIEEFLRPSLRHHEVDNRRFLEDTTIPELVRRGYSAVLDAIASGTTERLSSIVDAIDRELSENQPMVARYLADLELIEATRFRKVFTDQARLKEEVEAKLAAEQATLAAERATSSAERAAAAGEREQLAAARQHTAELEEAQGTLVAQLNDLRKQLALRQDELEAARKHTTELEQHQEKLVGQLDGLRQELAAARQHAADLEQHQGMLVGQLDGIREDLAAARQHTSDLEKHQGMLVTQLKGLQAELAATRAEREETVLQLNRTIGGRDGTIAQLSDAINSHAQTIAERGGTIARQDQQLVHVRQELAGYQQQRQILRQVMQRAWQTRSWRWTKGLRALQKRPLTLGDLIAATSMENVGPNRWRSPGPAHFIVPCLPVWGDVRIRLRLKCSVESQVLLFFDTGNFFNELQHFHLGTVTGELDVEEVYTLSEPVYCFRLDASQGAAEFEIETFEIQPLRSSARGKKA